MWFLWYRECLSKLKFTFKITPPVDEQTTGRALWVKRRRKLMVLCGRGWLVPASLRNSTQLGAAGFRNLASQ